jgi:hypothetical protein
MKSTLLINPKILELPGALPQGPPQRLCSWTQAGGLKIQFMKLNVYKSFYMTDISVIPYRLIIHSFTLKRALT